MYQKIKDKYNKPDMSDEVASKIKKLEILNKLFIIGTVIIGVITIIDIFTPDPLFLLDEATLAAITGLLKTLSSITKKKIATLIETNSLKITSKEIEDLSKDVTNVAKNVKRTRNKKED